MFSSLASTLNVAVKTGSVVYTDSARSYAALVGYIHDSVNHSQGEHARGVPWKVANIQRKLYSDLSLCKFHPPWDLSQNVKRDHQDPLLSFHKPRNSLSVNNNSL